MSTTHEYISTLISHHFRNKKISVIDYGCGNGDLLNFLDQSKISKYTGYEVSNDCLKVAKSKYQKDIFKFKKIDTIRQPELENNTDVIVLIGVLQYMSEKEIRHLLSEAKRKLSKNGILIASCATDHWLYKTFSLYQLFIPCRYINRKWILSEISSLGFKKTQHQEKGLIIAPLFSNNIALFFDILDRIVFKSRGKIGPIGSLTRTLIKPLLKLEFSLPIDYGYTLFLLVKNEK